MLLRIRFAPLLVLAFGSLLSAVAAAEETAASEGQELFLSYQCWQCHGYEGQGGGAARIAPTAYPYAAFVRFVRYPNVMPAYPTELLSDADLQSIYEYLKTIPEPPPLDKIPALNDL
jgi:mono/diheme cytochrome c family protein